MSKIYILIASLFLLTQLSFGKTDLRFNLKIGESYHQNMVAKSVINQVLSGKNMDMLMTMGGSTTYKVIAKEDSIYSMDVVYDSLSMSVATEGFEVVYSSENVLDTNDYVSILLAALKDITFKIKMSEKGRILEIKEFDNLFEKALVAIQKLEPKLRKQLEDNLKNSFGKENFKSSFETITAIFPDNLVNGGNEWQSVSLLNNNMPVKITTKYKFEGQTDDLYTITGVGSLVSYQPKDGIYNNTTPYIYDIKGDVVSEIKLDKSTCWIKEAVIKQEIKGYTMLKSDMGTSNPQKIEMEFKVKTTYND